MTLFKDFKRLEELQKLYADKFAPEEHIFSHIHGAYGIHEQDGITFVNCSILDDMYQVIHDPVILEVLHSAESI